MISPETACLLQRRQPPAARTVCYVTVTSRKKTPSYTVTNSLAMSYPANYR